MRDSIRYQMLVFTLLVLPVFAKGSELRIRLQHHTIAVANPVEREVRYGVFTDEALVFEVQLDVFEIPVIKASGDHLNELRDLPPDRWAEQLRWELVSREAGGHGRTELGTATFLNQNARERTDTSVPCRTYTAVVAFPAPPTGSYIMNASILDALSSKFRFEVRTGREPEWRDEFLHNKATHAKTWEEYKSYTLARLALDEKRLDIALEIVDRSLIYGSLDETRSHVERAQQIATVRQKEGTLSADGSMITARNLAELDEVLPIYYSNPKEYDLRRSVEYDGHFVLRSRLSGKIIRIVGEDQRR